MITCDENNIITKISDYTVLKTIGDGGYGMVYLVEDDQKNEYALKALKSSCNKKRLQTKIDILKKVSFNKNTIPLHKIFKDSKIYFFLYDYANEGDLKKYIKNNGVMNDKMIFDVLFSMLDILKYIHKENIIHSDIKPENILIKDGKYFLSDWSISENKKIVTSVLIETDKYYVSPECFSGTYDKKFDIYSLGCTLYFLATGKKIYDFNSKSTYAYTMFAHCMLGINYDIINSKKLKYLIYRMTDKNPETRASIEEINKILEGNNYLIFNEKLDTNYDKYKKMNDIELYKIMYGENINFAINNLGLLYENEESFRNINKSFELYKKASMSGLTVSMYNLALCYLKGKGTQKDEKNAYKLFVKASNNGHAKSMFYLANLYEKGIGIENDINKAIKLYKVSAYNGYKNSYVKLKELLKSDKKL